MARCIDGELDAYGAAVIGPLLSPEQCETLIHSYDNEELYRSRVVMARHGFGRGEYKYFAYPLPAVIAELRKCLYPYLVKIANGWNEAMGIDVRYPAEHEAFKARCHAAGQTRPTPQSNSPRRHGDTEKTEKKGLHGRPERSSAG